MSLSFEKRKKKILETLEIEEKVQVRNLAHVLQVSDETIRRDLERLEKAGLLRKVYGGAVKVNDSAWEPPFDQKTTINAQEKREICKTSAQLVNDDDIIFIGNGTTPLDLVRFLNQKKNITLITPSLPVLLLAKEVFHGRIIFIGGEFERNQKYTSGPLSEGMIQYLKADKAFIAAGGISVDGGITDYDIAGASISRKMMERADEVYILADYTKFGKTTFAYICEINEVSKIITDHKCPPIWQRILNEKEVELLIS